MYNVKVFHLPSEGGVQAARNFKVSEFKCNDGSAIVLINPELAELLQEIRDKAGKPIIINSAYRTPAYNKKIKGAANSMHMYGNAADIQCRGLTPVELHKIAQTILGGSGGLGLYKTFVHVDCRSTPSRWNG